MTETVFGPGVKSSSSEATNSASPVTISSQTGEPGVLQSMGSQRVGYNWGTEQQKALKYSFKFCCDVKIHM